MADRAVVIGVFDGVHRGHVCLIDQLKAAAAERGLRPQVFTFHQHPLKIINPTLTPARLTDNDTKRQLLKEQGVGVHFLQFSPKMQQLSAREFLEYIRQVHDVKLLMMGFNNSIGSDRLRGDSSELKQAATELGIELRLAHPLEGENVSSTAIRRALAEGDVERAGKMLGRPYSISGMVTRGQQLGRTIGFPTANITPATGMQLPKPGVYAGEVLGHKAVINVGWRPTVAVDAPINIEAHILDFNENIYYETIEIKFLRRLRDEQKFASIDDLKAQIHRDIENANL